MKINNELVNRIMNVLGYKTKKELALNLKISAPDLNNRIKSGSIKQLLIDHAIHHNVNVDWLLTGRENSKQDHLANNPVSENQASYNTSTAPAIKISELISKTVGILESQTSYSTALKSNIIAFHHAMTCEEQLDTANKRIDTLEEHVKSIESRLPPKTANGE